MPWNQESPMNQRIRLVSDWLSGNFTKIQLARRFGVQIRAQSEGSGWGIWTVLSEIS